MYILFDKNNVDDDHILVRQMHIEKISMDIKSNKYDVRVEFISDTGLAPFTKSLEPLPQGFVSQLFGTELPMFFQSLLMKSDPNQLAHIVTCFANTPFMFVNPNNMVINDDVICISYGIYRLHKDYFVTYNGMNLYALCWGDDNYKPELDITTFVHKLQKALEIDMRDLVHVDAELSNIGCTSLDWKNVVLVKGDTGWRTSSKKNKRVQEELARNGRYRNPLFDHETGTIRHYTKNQSAAVVEKCINHNEFCSLWQIDEYAVINQFSLQKTYRHLHTELIVRFCKDFTQEVCSSPYKGVYRYLIDKPKDIEVVDLIHEDQVTLRYEKGTIVAHPDQVEIANLESYHVDNVFDVYFFDIRNRFTNTIYNSYIATVAQNRVLLLHDRDVLVQKAKVQKRLIEELSK